MSQYLIKLNVPNPEEDHAVPKCTIYIVQHAISTLHKYTDFLNAFRLF